MVNKITPKNPEDDGFIHQYAGGVNQYGTKGAQSPDQFQSYMNDGMTTEGSAQSTDSTQSPFEVMAQQQNENFGAPPAADSSSADGAAPENFGPPGISQTSQGAQADSSFGAPGFQAPQTQSGTASSNQGSQTTDSNSQFGAPQTPPSQGGTAAKGGKQGASSAANNTSQPAPTKTHLDPAALKKKTSKKKVEKMEIDNMMQNIEAHMKVKDPDPGAWQ